LPFFTIYKVYIHKRYCKYVDCKHDIIYIVYIKGDNMAEDKSIFLIKNYGKVKIKLKEYLDAKNIKRSNLAFSIKTRFEVIDKWYNNEVQRVDLDVLARICYVLNCKVEDIIEYVDSKEDN